MGLLIFAIILIIFLRILVVKSCNDNSSSKTTNTLKQFKDGRSNIILVSAGENKEAALKEIIDILNCNETKGRNIIASVPVKILQNINEVDGIMLKKRLEEVGAIVDIIIGDSNIDINSITQDEVSNTETKNHNFNIEIVSNLCKGCTKCRRICPKNAIVGNAKEVHYINYDLCDECGLCVTNCPFNAIVKYQ